MCWIVSSHRVGALSPLSGNDCVKSYRSTCSAAEPTRTCVVILVSRSRLQKLGEWFVQSVPLVQFRSTGVSGQYSGCATVNWSSEQVAPAGVPGRQRWAVEKSIRAGAGAE